MEDTSNFMLPSIYSGVLPLLLVFFKGSTKVGQLIRKGLRHTCQLIKKNN